jgi:MFS family permease
MTTVLAVCALTFLHYAFAQIRTPILPLYAVEQGAGPTGVGLIMAAHMAAAAGASVPLGRAADRLGRRPLLLGGMAVGVVTSLLLPFIEEPIPLAVVFGIAGLGVAAFTPSAFSLVGDAAPAGRTAAAFGWYSTAHYGAIAVGPFLGGLVADSIGYRGALVVSGLGIALALVAASRLVMPTGHHGGPAADFAAVQRDPGIRAGWVLALTGMLVQGVVFTFLPLLAHARGVTPAAIGFVFLVLGLANVAVRWPAGWLIDRTGRCAPYALGGVLVAALSTALVPHVGDAAGLLALAALFGAASGLGFVAVSAALASAASASTRGVVMGGYSTAMYLGLALGSFTLGPVIAGHGHSAGFLAGAAAGVAGTLVVAVLWQRAGADA